VTAAHAQAVGGGGGGGTILNSAVAYFQNNIAANLGTLAVICIGIFLLASLDSICSPSLKFSRGMDDWQMAACA